LASKTKNYFFDYDTAKELNAGKQMKNLWDIPAERHLTEHPTEKPEALLERIILLGSRVGDTILDPFMGSGTTGAVAKKLARKFIGIEIDDNYFNIAKNRIKNMTIEISLF
jgi:site-specific DNA-methyltransferase (adenine-specific)